MTAQIAGFVTRAAAGLRAPRSVSHNITPGAGGVAVHYGGPAVGIKSHAQCAGVWRAWQAYHMDTHGWVDIAYTLGYCDHGYVFAGRGAGVRTAAQGTNDGNDRFYAAVWLGGDGEVPSSKAFDALDWILNELRLHGGAGMEVRPHRYFHSTSCPGDALAIRAGARNGKPITGPKPTPGPAPAPRPVLRLTTPPMHSQSVYNAQHAMYLDGITVHGARIKPDGIFGPNTDAATRAFQTKHGLTPDGIIGDGTWTALGNVPGVH